MLCISLTLLLQLQEVIWYICKEDEKQDHIYHVSLHDKDTSHEKYLMVVMTSRTVRYKMKLLEDGRVEVTEEEVNYIRYNYCLTVFFYFLGLNRLWAYIVLLTHRLLFFIVAIFYFFLPGILNCKIVSASRV